MTTESLPGDITYAIDFPADYRPGVGIIGFGMIARYAHIKAYRRYNVNVVGVYDKRPEQLTTCREKYGIERIYSSLDELLADPAVEVVDIVTWPEQRVEIMRKALAAGKHILAQKPFTPSMETAREIAAEARHRGLKIAVNLNARWAPPFRTATALVEQGFVGDVLSVTHVINKSFRWMVETPWGQPYDKVQHSIIYDTAIHWMDITKCWFGDRSIKHVRAAEFRTPDQPETSNNPWGMWIEICYEDGGHALIRSVGCSRTSKQDSPFWIHGTKGTIRGNIQADRVPDIDMVEFEQDGNFYPYPLEGEWFFDGFAGPMAELTRAIDEKREASCSIESHLLSQQIGLAACFSAEQDGRAIRLDELPETYSCAELF